VPHLPSRAKPGDFALTSLAALGTHFYGTNTNSELVRIDAKKGTTTAVGPLTNLTNICNGIALTRASTLISLDGAGAVVEIDSLTGVATDAAVTTIAGC